MCRCCSRPMAIPPTGGADRRDARVPPSASCAAARSWNSPDVPPMRTVLDYLRLDERSRGTKEGCNEGDCGACTVALGSLRDGRLVYEPVNACILLLGQLDGKELVTVDDLSTDGAAASGAAGAGRHAWLAMRLLHAGLRHVAVHALSAGRGADARRDRHPHRRQSLPLHRLPPDHRCRAGLLHRQGGGPLGQGAQDAAAHSSQALDDGADVFVGTPRQLHRPARAAPRRWRGLRRSIPMPPSSRAPPMSACGSPSRCASCRRSSSPAG